MTPAEKLDYVLKYLATTRPVYIQYSDSGLLEKLRQNGNEFNDENSGGELISILEKLHKDGYASIEEKYFPPPILALEGSTVAYYKITFEGVYFIKHLDGYRGLDRQKMALLRADQDKQYRIERLESYQLKISMAALIISLSVVLWEILKYFLFDHHWYRHYY